MSYSRREKNGAEQSQFIPSAPEAVEPKMIPFAQRLLQVFRPTIAELVLPVRIPAEPVETAAFQSFGCAAFVLVRSLQGFLDPNSPNASSVRSRRRSDSHETGNPT